MLSFRTLTAFVCVLALAGCGGGGGGGGDSNRTSISISPTSVTLNANEGGATPAPVTVRVNFVGDGVIVGYAPGVPEPAWLHINAVSNTNTTADFSLSVSGTNNPGTYSTSVRFVTGHADGSDIRSVDLPVSYTVVASDLSLTTSASSLSFGAIAQTAVPAAQTITATYNGEDVNVLSVPFWLTVTRTNPGVNPASFSIAPNSTTFAPGSTMSAQLTFVTTRAGSTVQRQRTVHVSYVVAEPFSAVAPTLTFESVAGLSQAQPVDGYILEIRGELAHWRITGEPSWLEPSSTSGTGRADVLLRADPTGLSFGTLSGQFSVIDDTSGTTRTFPVTITHRAARLVAQPTSLEFSLDSESTPSALSQSIAISDELGGTQAGSTVTWSLQSTGAPWLTISPNSGSSVPGGQITVHLDEDALGDVRGGDHSATIKLVFQNAQAANQTLSIPVTLHNHLARVEFVSPYIGLANVAGTLIARGTDFGTAGQQVTVDVGATQIGAVTLDSETQLSVNYPALPVGRYPVSIRNELGVESTAGDLVVHAPPAFAYQAINVAGNRSRIVYDAERLALYAIDRTAQQIEHYEYAMGMWSAAPSTVIPDLTDIALAPDGRSLTTLTRNVLREIDLNSSPLTAVSRAQNPDPFCGGFFDKVAIANSGKAFIIFNLGACSGYTPSYLFDVRDYSLTTNIYFDGYLYNGIVGASADGSRLYAGSNGVSPAPEVKIFTAATNTIANSPVNHNLFAVSVSGNASRVILQNEDVYDRTLQDLTGRLHSGGVALASRDSTRAFVYRDDGNDPRIVVYDLNGALLPGALYPVLQTIDLADSPNASSGQYLAISLTASPDDATLFVSGNARILVVPVN